MDDEANDDLSLNEALLQANADCLYDTNSSILGSAYYSDDRHRLPA